MKVAHEAEFPAAAMAAILFAVSTVSAGYGIVLPILPLILQAIDGPTATAAISHHTGLLARHQDARRVHHRAIGDCPCGVPALPSR